MSKNYLFASISGIALVAILTGCAQSESASGPASQRHIGMANPASVYCISQKGQLDNVNTAKGVASYCTLPSGERVDEWVLFRRDHPQK